jgi:Dolichyl-phosphate-mannose-protein mannosyltransferase
VSSEVAVRPREIAWTRAIPAWAWLGGIVVLSAIVRYGFGRRMIAPWIMIDELVYSELAKGIAESGRLEIRGEAVGTAYGVVYPLLIAPAYALFDSVPSAYAAAKAINGIAISLAAVPAYFLARRVVQPGLALLAAGLSVALPSMLYAGTLMTENAFYPLFLCAALALVLALERPTPGRVLVLLAVGAIAFATRAQALVLVPALLVAPLLIAPRRLRDYRWLYGLTAAAGLAVLLVQLVRGRSLLDLLGAYRVTGEERYDVSEVARWLLYHAAELDLSLGVAPFAALLLLALTLPRLEARDRVFVAAAVSLSACLLVQVAAFASRHSLRVEERNMFYLAPLFLIALLLWIERGLPRPPLPTAIAAVTAAVLPALLPFSTLIGVSAVSDTFGLLPWWTVHEWGVALDRLWVVVLLCCAWAAALFVLVSPRWALVLPALLLLFFAVSTQPVAERTRTASIGALFQGITRPERDWVDRAADGEVVAVWTGRNDSLTVLENEFFSRSVGRVYTTSAQVPGGLAQEPLAPDLDTGLLRDLSGRPVRADYALVHDSYPLVGSPVARDEVKEMAVVATDGPLRLEHALTGTYGDGWSGPTATYRNYRCAGGTLAATVESDPSLFAASQTLVARVDGRVAARGTIPREGEATLLVPLRTNAAGQCVVRFSVSPVAVPGGGDPRRLGTHFRGFDVRP